MAERNGTNNREKLMECEYIHRKIVVSDIAHDRVLQVRKVASSAEPKHVMEGGNHQISDFNATKYVSVTSDNFLY